MAEGDFGVARGIGGMLGGRGVLGGRGREEGNLSQGGKRDE